MTVGLPTARFEHLYRHADVKKHSGGDTRKKDTRTFLCMNSIYLNTVYKFDL
jgi:hypothetical protein